MKRPNILLITSDQQHFDTIGAFNSEIKTPNIDRLVNEGMTYSRAYCCNPTCTPTRASIITGQYPSQHGAWSLGTKLPESQNTIGHEFQRNGYRSTLIGKAHFQPLASTDEYPSLEAYPILHDLDFWRNYDQDFYGFNHIELARNHTTEAHVGQHYAIWLEEQGLNNWRDYFVAPTGTLDENVMYKWDIPEEYHYNAWIAERTNAMLEQYKQNDENFFLWSSFFDPHPDYFAPEPWDTMYNPDELTLPSIAKEEHKDSPPHHRKTQENNPDFSEYKESGQQIHGFHCHLKDEDEARKDMAVYYGMVSLMDKYIGKILDKLDELGIRDNTVVIFTTDHGHFFGQHGLVAKGAFHYEDMIKVPFIVRYPDRIKPNTSTDSLISLVDIAPTLLSLCNIDIPNEMTGVDQRDVLFGEKKAVRDHIICENHHEPTTVHLKTFVDKRYKLTVYYNKTYGELYDLEKDPKEINNLWDLEEYKDLKSELLLKFLWAELGKEPMWMPRIKEA